MSDLQDYITEYLEVCRKRKKLSLKTVKAYRLDLEQFRKSIPLDTAFITKAHINNYVMTLHDSHKPKSIKRKLAALKVFFNYLEEEYEQENPFSHIRFKIREPPLLPKTIPLGLIQTLLKTVYEKLPLHKKGNYSYTELIRDIAILELLFATGMRVSEVCSLSIVDINLTEGVVRVCGKGSKIRLVQIVNPEVIHALRNYEDCFASHIIETGFFFINRLNRRLSPQSVRLMLRKHTKEAGISMHITPHMFRHSFATLLLEEDVDIRYIQQFLGHSSIITTQIYTHVTSEKQKSILTAKHPRNKLTMYGVGSIK